MQKLRTEEARIFLFKTTEMELILIIQVYFCAINKENLLHYFGCVTKTNLETHGTFQEFIHLVGFGPDAIKNLKK